MLNQTQLTLPGIPMPDTGTELAPFSFADFTFGVEIECAGAADVKGSAHAYTCIKHEETGLCYDALLYLNARDLNTEADAPPDYAYEIEDASVLAFNLEETLESLEMHSDYPDVLEEMVEAWEWELWETRVEPAMHGDDVVSPVLIVSSDGTSLEDWEMITEWDIEGMQGHTAELDVNLRSAGFDGWSIVEDRSLDSQAISGFEVVSPKLRGENGIQQVTDICAYLRNLGTTLDDSCGIHIHVGSESLTLSQLKKLAVEWLRIETQLLSIPNYRRRTSKYFAKTGKTDARFISEIDDEHTLIRHMCPNGRRYALNMRALGVHGTVEFRGFRSTLDAVEIEKDIRIACSIVQAAM